MNGRDWLDLLIACLVAGVAVSALIAALAVGIVAVVEAARKRHRRNHS